MLQRFHPGRRAAVLAIIIAVLAGTFLPALCAAQTSATSPPSGTAATGLLAPGGRGQAVIVLQQELAAAGYNPGKADGVFGPQTLKAVLEFQKARGLKADGVAGPLTLAALSSPPASPVPAPSSGLAPAPASPPAASNPTPPKPARAVATPKPLAGKTICLDPGHGSDSGARGAYSREDPINLAAARNLRDLLRNAGAEVVMTRDGWANSSLPGDPYGDTLDARVTIAEESHADAFVSIHSDWNPNPAIAGVTTYYYPNDWTSYPLAKAVQAGMVRRTGRRNVGVLSAAYYVLHWTTMPAVLVEMGFLSNSREEALLNQASYRQSVAQGIYEGICSFFKVSPVPPSSGGTTPPPPPPPPTPPPTPPASGARPKVLTYWARWGTDTRPGAALEANKKRIDLVVPYWFTAQGDGSLVSRETGHSTLVKTVHAAGGKVLALINRSGSSYAMITSSGVRSRLVDSIQRVVQAEGLDGVNIDLEGLQPTHRAGLTALVKAVTARLRPLGKQVLVSVPPKWSEDESTNDWAAAYDYDALSAACDGVQVMTYDQHGEWSGAGAVAGLPWVKQVVAYAVKHCPRNKLWLGVAGYGYDWSSAGTATVNACDAVALAQSKGATIVWDDTEQEAHFSYTDSRGRVHQVWFENSYSASQKLRLAVEERLAGVALWSLGQEDARFWTVVNDELGSSR